MSASGGDIAGWIALAGAAALAATLLAPWLWPVRREEQR